MRKSVFGVSERPTQTGLMDSVSKFQIKEVDGLYYLCSKNKGHDQLHGYHTADLRLCFLAYAKSRLSHDVAHLHQ